MDEFNKTFINECEAGNYESAKNIFKEYLVLKEQNFQFVLGKLSETNNFDISVFVDLHENYDLFQDKCSRGNYEEVKDIYESYCSVLCKKYVTVKEYVTNVGQTL